MFVQAQSLESAVRSSESYSALLPPINTAIPPVDVPPELSTDPATLAASGLQGQNASSVETIDILVPSALHVMLHALTAGKRGTSKGFVVEGLLLCLQREHRLLCAIRLLRWSLLQWCPVPHQINDCGKHQ